MKLDVTTSKSTKPKKAVTIKKDKNSTGTVIAIVLLLLLFAGIIYSLHLGWRKFYLENPELNIQDIIVTETENYSGPKVEGKISVHTILSELGVETNLDNNIIELDIRKIRERLEQEPLLKNVEVRKIMPRTLSIKFEERVPQAIVFGGRKTCYIDKDAYILPLRYKDDTQLKYNVSGLPVITAVKNLDILIPGKPVNDKYLDAALSLLRKVQSHPGNSYFKIKQLQISSQEDLLITTIEPLPNSKVFAPNCNITFPVFSLNEAVGRLFHIASQYKNAPPITKIDVSYKDNIPFQNTP